MTLRDGIFVVTSYLKKAQMVKNMTSTSFEAMPIGLLLYELQNLICDFAVAEWVEGMFLYGVSDKMWSQGHWCGTIASHHFVTAVSMRIGHGQHVDHMTNS